MRQIMEVKLLRPRRADPQAIPILVNGIEPAIINVASMCGRRAMPAWSEYSASKYALCGLTEALARQLARFDIDILLIVPASLKVSFRSTSAFGGEGEDRIRQGDAAADVAARIVRSLQKNKTETWIGSDTQWMLRVNRWFPRFVDYMLARKVRKLYEAG